MRRFSFGASSLGHILSGRLEKSITALCLTIGLVAAGQSNLPAYSSESTQSNPQNISDDSSIEPSNSPALADGTYLYGQSPERDQIGSAYMVFEVEQGEVVGAFYMPHSSFDCFYGSLQTDRLALTVVDSYEQTRHPYSIALEPQDTLATTDEDIVAPMGLEGFHPIENLSENDRRILATCQADFQ